MSEDTNKQQTPITTDGYSNLLNLLTQEKNSLSNLSENDLKTLQDTLTATTAGQSKKRKQEETNGSENKKIKTGATAEEQEMYINNLLSQNNLIISNIRENILKGSLESNHELMKQFRANIIQILTCMSKMPGIMSQMPPIPIKLNSISDHKI
eukprot:gene3419-5964_t